MVLETWEFFASSVLDIMDMDFVHLKIFVPILDPIMQVMLAIGWAVLIGNLVFQAVKTMMTGLGFEGEDPKLLFTRTFVFSFLLLASPQICQLGLNMTAAMIDLLNLPNAVDIRFSDSAIFGGLNCAWLLVIIADIVILFHCFKLIVEMAERYFILAVLTICAPLAFGTGGSRNTADIFTGWCRMYGSMCLLMVLQVMFIKILFSALSYVPTGLDFLPWFVLLLVIVKTAKKIDAIVTRIGLNPAITGDSLGRSLPGTLTYMVVRSLAAQAGKTISKNGGGHSGKAAGPNPNPRGPNPPPGTGGRKSDGRWFASAVAGKSKSSGATSTADNTSQTGQPNGSATPPNVSPTHSTESATGTGGAATAAQERQSWRAYRQSKVPAGTRYSPSHINREPRAGNAAGQPIATPKSDTTGASVAPSQKQTGPGTAQRFTSGKTTQASTHRSTAAAQERSQQETRRNTGSSRKEQTLTQAGPISRSPNGKMLPASNERHPSTADIRVTHRNKDPAQQEPRAAPLPHVSDMRNSAAERPGTAGKAPFSDAASADNAPRRRRNAPHSAQGSSSAPAPSPVPQEHRAPPQSAGTMRNPSVKQPGTAGKAASSIDVPSTRKSAAPHTGKASPVPPGERSRGSASATPVPKQRKKPGAPTRKPGRDPSKEDKL